MVLEILLIISILLQLVAAFIAIGLIRKTKYNLSWMLFTIALCLMGFMRYGEYTNIAKLKDFILPPELYVWVGVTTSLCFAAGVILVQKIFTYISKVEHERRRSERRILNVILTTEERERQRFSKELHDGLGPLLSSAKMSLSALSQDDIKECNRDIIKNTNYVIDEAIRSVREISVNLSPHILNDFGFAKAVSSFIHKLPREGMKIDFKTNLTIERFDIDVEVILYRVVCELISNSLKHSEATRINIDVEYNNGNISIIYKDNGRGFDPQAVGDQGLGMSNMNSRINSLKGEIAINSKPEEGMNAIIKIKVS